jgi:hypothetical protein
MPAAEIAQTGARSLFYAYSDEYRLLPPNLPLLRALTAQTGGALAPDAHEIFRPRDDGGTRVNALWPLCVALALALFLLDVAVRRMPWAPSSKSRSKPRSKPRS